MNKPKVGQERDPSAAQPRAAQRQAELPAAPSRNQEEPVSRRPRNRPDPPPRGGSAARRRGAAAPRGRAASREAPAAGLAGSPAARRAAPTALVRGRADRRTRAALAETTLPAHGGDPNRLDGEDGHDRVPVQAQGVHLPGLRDLRRHRQHLRLRAARRRAQAARQGGLVEPHGHGARRRRRPRLGDHPEPARCGRPRATSGASPTRWSTARSARARFRADKLEDARCPEKPSQAPGRVRRRADRAARVQPDVQDERRRRSRTSARSPTCGPETAQGIFLNFMNVLRRRAPEAAVRHRADRQVVPQRDHARQLRVPHARVRAGRDGVLRAARARTTSGTSTGASERLQLVPRLRHPAREAAPARARQGRARALLDRRTRHRVRVPLRLGRARGHRLPHRLRPASATPRPRARTCGTSTRRRRSSTSPS